MSGKKERLPPLRTKIMAVLNVTPDSFSDGGRYIGVESALRRTERLVTEGADIIDIGGESTRPFSEPVSEKEELRRVSDVIAAIRKQYPSLPLSIDTTKAEVARRAIAAGANIVNDISACRMDAKMPEVVAETGVPIIIMHMQGNPADMQVNPRYDDVVEEILRFFKERVDFLVAAGIKRERITLDPGIGFGKRLEHNLSIIKGLARFSRLGLPVLLAHSRKSFLGEITGIDKARERDFATAVVAACVRVLHAGHVDMVRVHNVAVTKEALRIAEAVNNAGRG